MGSSRREITADHTNIDSLSLFPSRIWTIWTSKKNKTAFSVRWGRWRNRSWIMNTWSIPQTSPNRLQTSANILTKTVLKLKTKDNTTLEFKRLIRLTRKLNRFFHVCLKIKSSSQHIVILKIIIIIVKSLLLIIRPTRKVANLQLSLAWIMLILKKFRSLKSHIKVISIEVLMFWKR